MRLFAALRPAQWTKNLLCFVPLVFTSSYRDPASLLAALLSFAAFCGLSSAAYLANDVVDRKTDRENPRTARRPVASGEVTPVAALFVAAFLAFLGLALARAIGILPVALGFLFLQALYILGGRERAGLDVALIGCTFVMRAVGGAEAIRVPTSPWLFGIAFLVAARIVLAKRAAEAAANTPRRASLAEVPVETWHSFGSGVTGAILATYALYAFTSETASRIVRHLPADVPPLLLTFPFVLYALFRFEVLARRGQGLEPERLVWCDPPLFFAVLGWFLTVLFALYA